MLPFNNLDTLVFEDDQRFDFSAQYWDTPFSAHSGGIEYAQFDILADIAPAAGRAGIEAVLGDPNLTRSVLDYVSACVYQTGVVPLIYNYWGSGSPPGGMTPRYNIVKYHGYVKQAGTVTIVLGGLGQIRGYVNQTTSLFGADDEVTVRDPLLDIDIDLLLDASVDKDEIERQCGYKIVEYTFAKGDEVELYYIQENTDWGGVFAKVMWHDTMANITDSWDTFSTALRNAPPIGCSWLGIESDGEYLSAVQIPYITEGTVENNREGMASLTMKVAVAAADDDSEGFNVVNEEGIEHLEDNASETILKKGRLIQFSGGYRQGTTTREMYPRFKGFIEDIQATEDHLQAIITAKGIESRMGREFDENYPDRLSYHANAYVFREWKGYPVWPIMAFDAWPFEDAIKELGYRSGIDGANFGLKVQNTDPEYARFDWYNTSTGEYQYGRRFFESRHLSDNDHKVYLQRKPRYGNVGLLRKDYLPQDSEYTYGANINRRLFDRAVEISDSYGYEFRFNADGFAILNTKNNPVRFEYFNTVDDYTGGSDAHQVHPSAVGGRVRKVLYSEIAGVGEENDAEFTFEGNMSRMDLFVGVGTDSATELASGVLNVTVERRNSLVANTWTTVDQFTWDTFWEGGDDLSFYYDDPIVLDPSEELAYHNAAAIRVFELPMEYYRVTIGVEGISSRDTAPQALLWFNGVAIYERNATKSGLWNTDGTTVREISTLNNAISISPDSQQADLRNHVIVVGARKATVPDSNRLVKELGGVQDNFRTAVASDPFSVYLPSSPNFIGGKNTVLVVDDKVADDEFASWLSAAILYRYRMPRDAASFEHTAIPFLEVGDPLKVSEPKFSSVDHLLWVQSFTETWTISKATVSVQAVSYPEIPSYQPREQIPIDTLFAGLPVVGMELSYKNIYGQEVDNENLHNPDIRLTGYDLDPVSSEREYHKHQLIGSSFGTNLTSVPIPETIGLRQQDLFQNINEGSKVYNRFLVNNPYRHFFDLKFNDNGTVYVEYDFQEGDGTEDVYDQDYYFFPNKPDDADYELLTNPSWYVRYRWFGTRTGENPFYDPYTSEIGNLVNISFDSLVSGFYRVSIWYRDEARELEMPVAWITEAKNDALEPEDHWAFFEPGANRRLYWDGIDNIGYYNRYMSLETGELIQGSFGEEPTVVGAGFYAWNDKHTDRFTQIGDAVNSDVEFESRNFNPSLNTYLKGPFFTIGQYSRFYVKIEAMNDDLLRADLSDAPREVASNSLDTTNNWNNVSSTYIWSHLGEPTQAHIKAYYWDPDENDAGEWDIYNYNDGWKEVQAIRPILGTPTEGVFSGLLASFWAAQPPGRFRDGAPVKFQFQSVPRRGYMFLGEDGYGDRSLINVKLHRQAHLKATVFEQFYTFFGIPWEGSHENNPQAEEKRVSNKMYHVDTHTLSYNDVGWRDGEEIEALEWIFQPDMFVKDFGNGREILRYGDYEQLASLDHYTPLPGSGTNPGPRSYMSLAYLGYLFYFSAFTLDRSGRRQWCLDRWVDPDAHNVHGYIDRSKIVTPDWIWAHADPTLSTRLDTSTATGWDLGLGTDYDEIGVRVDATASFRVKTVEIYMRSVGTPTGVVFGEFRDSNGDVTPLGTSGNIDADTIGATYEKITFTFDEAVSLEAGGSYYFYLTMTGGGGSFEIRGGTNDTATGNMAYNNGGSFSLFLGRDIAATIYDADYKQQYVANYERTGADKYLARSIFTRQWVEPTWATADEDTGAYYANSPMATWNIPETAHEAKFVQARTSAFDYTSTIFQHDDINNITDGTFPWDRYVDKWVQAWGQDDSYVNTKIKNESYTESTLDFNYPQGPPYFATPAIMPYKFGGDPDDDTTGYQLRDRGGYTNFFAPSPARDFQPYWRMPLMPDWAIHRLPSYVWSDVGTGDVSYHYGLPMNVLKLKASDFGENLRDHARSENWHGYAWTNGFSETYYYSSISPGSRYGQFMYYGAVLEGDASQELAEDIEAQMTVPDGAEAFWQARVYNTIDYEKNDTLDRFDQFRGCYSRGAYEDSEGWNRDTTWTDDKKIRVGPLQPVAPTGHYFTNLGRYSKYYVGPIHEDVPNVNIHFVPKVENFSELRFRTEYVWHNSLYFPTDYKTAAMYSLTRNEYTQASAVIRNQWFWQNETESSMIYYDPGAWTGWKDDTLLETWESDPFLRWAENSVAGVVRTDRWGVPYYTTPWGDEDYPWASGGDHLDPSGNAAMTGTDEYTDWWMGKPESRLPYQRVNIFDEARSHYLMRLAVGPEVPENDELVMNLVLSARLAGIEAPGSQIGSAGTIEAPTYLAATTGYDYVDLTWVFPDNIDHDGFEIYRDDSLIGTVEPTERTYHDAGLTNGDGHFYKVRAYLGTTPGTFSTQLLVFVGSGASEGAPNAPTDLSVSNILYSSTLTWADNSTDETGWRIYREDTFLLSEDLNVPARLWKSISTTSTLGTTTDSYEDTEYSFGTYRYWVSATVVDGGGNTLESPLEGPYTVVPVLDGSGGSRPISPTGLTISQVISGEANFEWTDNSDDETGFFITAYAPSIGDTYHRVVSWVGTNITAATVTGLVPGAAYWFSVYSYKDVNGAMYPSLGGSGIQNYEVI